MPAYAHEPTRAWLVRVGGEGSTGNAGWADGGTAFFCCRRMIRMKRMSRGTALPCGVQGGSHRRRDDKIRFIRKIRRQKNKLSAVILHLIHVSRRFFPEKTCYVRRNYYFCKRKRCGSGSVGRALASQAEGRGFESRLPLKVRNLCY